VHHFFSNDIQGQTIFLSEEESRHCTKVMRLTIGDEVMVFDGKGKQYLCQISQAKNIVALEITKIVRSQNKPTLELTLAVSPTKSSDRMEWMLEKLVEIGVSRLVFIRTEKGERSRLNIKRLEKKAVSALKQSGNLWMPTIETDVKFKDFIKSNSAEGKYIAHCFDSDKTQLNSSFISQSVCVLIGPEGDFSQGELELATQNDFTPLSLGLPRYRTETAAVVASTLINHFCVTLAS